MEFNHKIYYQPKNKLYFATELISDITGNLIESMGILYTAMSRNPSIKTVYLVFDSLEVNNAKQHFNKKLYDVTSTIAITIVEVIPICVTMYIPQPLTLSNFKGDLSCYDVANTQLGNETITDKTKYAGKIEFNKQDGATLEDRDKKQLKYDDLNNPVYDINSFMENLKVSSNKAIEQHEKKQIEHEVKK